MLRKFDPSIDANGQKCQCLACTYDPATDDVAATSAKRLKAAKARLRRKLRDDAMRSLGLVKVKGAVSGRTYWE